MNGEVITVLLAVIPPVRVFKRSVLNTHWDGAKLFLLLFAEINKPEGPHLSGTQLCVAKEKQIH